MIQSYEPHRLVIQHLSVLESAPAIVGEVEKQVFAAIDEKVQKWVGVHDEWEGIFDFLDDETSFKPISWEKAEDETWPVCYSLQSETDEGFSSNLAPLFGVVPVRYGAWFLVNVNWITRLAGRGARPGAAWKNFLAAQFPLTKLAEHGFELQGESLFMPVRVDAQVLAEDFPDSIGDALAPIDEALKKLEAAHPEIDALLNAALAHQFDKSKQSTEGN